MARAIDNPTETFLKFLNDGGLDLEEEQTVISPALKLAQVDVGPLSEGLRVEILQELFAELVDACRRSRLNQAVAVTEAIERLSEVFAPELIDLARSMVAEAKGQYREAEALTSACLRRTHIVPEVTRPAALVQRATHRMRLGLLDAALLDLAEFEAAGPSLLSLHGLAIRALIHWWRGDQGQAVDALEQGPRHLIKGVDLGVGWYALAAELVKNGQIFQEDLGHHKDCLAREFWEARPEFVVEAYVSILGPHVIRHAKALGNNEGALLSDMQIRADPGSAAGIAFRWCQGLVASDSQQLAEIADEFRDRGSMLSAIEAYRDAASCASTDDARDRLLRRGRFLHDRLSRAVKVSSKPDLPVSLARQLTDAEQNVVAAVAQGLSNKEAAERLHCSVRTIESHLTSAYKKLGIRRRTQLAVLIAQANVS